MNNYQLLIPDSMNYLFFDETEKITAQKFMEYVFYDKKPEASPQIWQDAEILIRYLKRDVWFLDDERKQSGGKAVNIYAMRYVMEHLSKQEICEIVGEFFCYGGNKRLMALFENKLHVKLDELMITQEKRIVTKKDFEDENGHYDWWKYYKIFDYPGWVEFDDGAFDEIASKIYSGDFLGEKILYFLGASDDFEHYDKWFYLVKHILMTTRDFEVFWLAGDILNIIWITVDQKDKETSKWIKDQIFEIFWYRVGGIWPLLHLDELNNNADNNEAKILKDAIGWLKSLDDLTKRLPELLSNYDLNLGDSKKYFKEAMREFRKIAKRKKISIDELGRALEKVTDEIWDRDDANEFEKFVSEVVIPNTDDKKFLVFVKNSIRHVQRNIKRAEIESRNIAGVREHLKNWPEKISALENPEFLNEIKLEHIIEAECERDDLYYEKASSSWSMDLKLLVNGKECVAWISDQGLYHRYYDMIVNSGEFDSKSEILMQCGKEVFTRK